MRGGGIRDSGGAGRWSVHGWAGEGEGLDVFVFHETPDIATPVFGV